MDLKKEKEARLPRYAFQAVVVVSITPIILNLFGYDFGNQKTPFDLSAKLGMSPAEVMDGMFHSMSGAFTQTILEWSAFSICSDYF